MSTPPEIQRLIDHEDIRQLVAKYDFAFTERDEARYIECLTEDCHIERRNSEPRCTGHEQLVRLVRDFPVAGFRVSTGLHIDVHADAAVMRSYLLYIDVGPPSEISMVGVWNDKLARTSTGWKFSERIFDPLSIRESEVSSEFMKASRKIRNQQ